MGGKIRKQHLFIYAESCRQLLIQSCGIVLKAVFYIFKFFLKEIRKLLEEIVRFQYLDWN